MGVSAAVLSQIVIQVPKHITDEFKVQAKLAFPNETYAYLFGHQDNGVILVDCIYVPEGVDDFCNKNTVNVQPNWDRAAKREAKKKGLTVVGDIHSHPFKKKDAKLYANDTSPSETDWNGLEEGKIMGICLIRETKDHKLRARTSFWGPMPQVKVETTK